MPYIKEKDLRALHDELQVACEQLELKTDLHSQCSGLCRNAVSVFIPHYSTGICHLQNARKMVQPIQEVRRDTDSE